VERSPGVTTVGRWLTGAAVVIGLGVAGCGSSSSKPKLTKAEFLTQANAICQAGNARTNALGTSLGAHPSQAKILKVTTGKIIPEVQGEITAVRALAVQTADKTKLTSMLDLAQSDLNKVQANPTLLFTSASSSPFRDFATQAHSYGLTRCASGA